MSQFRACILPGLRFLADYVTFGTTRLSQFENSFRITSSRLHLMDPLMAQHIPKCFAAQHGNVRSALLGTGIVNETVSFNSTRFVVHRGHTLCRPHWPRPWKAAAPELGHSICVKWAKPLEISISSSKIKSNSD